MPTKKGKPKTNFRWEYMSWLLINVILCAITIGTTFAFSDKTAGFSSLLAYYFTATAIVVCLAVHYAMTINGELDEERNLGKEKFLIISGLVLAVSAISLYFVYIFNTNIKDHINNWLAAIIPTTVFLYLGVDFYIAKPQIHRQAIELEETNKARRTMKAKQKTENWGKAVTSRMKKEGLK